MGYNNNHEGKQVGVTFVLSKPLLPNLVWSIFVQSSHKNIVKMIKIIRFETNHPMNIYLTLSCFCIGKRYVLKSIAGIIMRFIIKPTKNRYFVGSSQVQSPKLLNNNTKNVNSIAKQILNKSKVVSSTLQCQKTLTPFKLKKNQFKD